MLDEGMAKLIALPSTRHFLNQVSADRFVYRSVNVESKEIERQYPTDEDLKRIAKFRERNRPSLIAMGRGMKA